MSDYKYSIEAKKVNKFFSKNSKIVNALSNFNIKIKKGTIHGLLGPNGAGKSTFINILGGLVKKDTGKVSICGIDIDTHSKLSKFKIGIVPQELNIDPFFSPAELLELQAGLYGIPKRKRITDAILENLSLMEQRNAYARTLSGGMRRRLLIAKALVHNPEMLILDEPTAGVDINLRTSLWKYIKKINSKGTTICLTTHYLEEAEKLCNNITILDKGKIIIDDKKEKIINIVSSKKVSFNLINFDNKDLEFEEFDYKINGNLLEIEYDKNKLNLNQIIKILERKNIYFTEINTSESNLEDAFLKLTQNENK